MNFNWAGRRGLYIAALLTATVQHPRPLPVAAAYVRQTRSRRELEAHDTSRVRLGTVTGRDRGRRDRRTSFTGTHCQAGSLSLVKAGLRQLRVSLLHGVFANSSQLSEYRAPALDPIWRRKT